MRNFKTYTYLLFAVLSLSVLSSCGEDVPEDDLLQEYFTENNITPQRTSSGLYYVIDVPGSTQKPTATSTVTVNYRGYYLNGEEFDSSYSRGEPSSFPLNGVIQGWTEGMQLFGRGGSGSLYMPSSLGYGGRGRGDIPGFTPLAFDIEVLDFQ